MKKVPKSLQRVSGFTSPPGGHVSASEHAERGDLQTSPLGSRPHGTAPRGAPGVDVAAPLAGRLPCGRRGLRGRGARETGFPGHVAVVRVLPGCSVCPGGARRPVAQGPRGLLGWRPGAQPEVPTNAPRLRTRRGDRGVSAPNRNKPSMEVSGRVQRHIPAVCSRSQLPQLPREPPPALWPRSEAAAWGARRRCRRRPESLPALHPSLRSCLLLRGGDCSRPRLPGLDCGSRQVSVVQTGCSRTSELASSQRQEGPRISRRVLRPQPPTAELPNSAFVA